MRLHVLIAVAISIALHSAAAEGEPMRELGQVKLKELNEISGIAASRQNPEVLWLHNDGNSRLVFAVSSFGDLWARVRLPVHVEDSEDIAIGPGSKPEMDYLYLGDIGDNDERRREIRVVRFLEPELSGVDGGKIDIEAVESFRLIYPDGPHNAEGLFVDPASGDLFIVTKEKRTARLYTCPNAKLVEGVVIALDLVGKLNVDEVSGGAISPDGSRIILRREDQGWLWNRNSDQSIVAALRGTPTTIVVRGPRQGRNGESVTFSPDGGSYYTVSEGKKQVICEFQLPTATSRSSR